MTNRKTAARAFDKELRGKRIFRGIVLLSLLEKGQFEASGSYRRYWCNGGKIMVA